MSLETTLEEVREFLEGPHRAVIATVGADSSPHIVVVDYLVEGDGLLLNGRQDRRWVRNVRTNPRLAALVHDPLDVGHWVSLSGSVELLREGDEAAVEDAKTMSRRYGDDPDYFNGQYRVSWRLVPTQVLERRE